MDTAVEFAKFARQRAQAEALAGMVTTCPREIVVPICAAAIDHLGAGMPEAENMFSDLREDAAFWAETASPHELREYLAAALKSLTDQGYEATMVVAPRKRLLVALWNSLSEIDKRKFLDRVDPKGVFRGAA